MPNAKLDNKTYNVPPELQQYLGGSISYENMKMTKTRLNQSKNGNPNEYNSKGGDAVLNWITNELKKDTTAIRSTKKIGMDTGRENQFIRTHEKDKDNANPTNPNSGLIKVNKGTTYRRVMTGKEVYNESINKEINQIRYLMEYMNNKKKQKP
jgi:hypothetical protein